jgi:HEAT repeat protein
VLDDDIHWIRWYAAEALGQIGPDAESAGDALAAATRHEDHQTRVRAVRALGQIGPRAQSCLHALTRAREADPQSAIRRAAEAALRQISSDGEEALALDKEIRGLVAKLGDRDGFERVGAAEELAGRGPNAAPAILALTKALEHEDKWLRAAAAEALGSIGREAASAVPALRQILKDPEPEVRAAGQQALEKVPG